MRAERQSTGVTGLDRLLGGGLVPGTLTVVLGATGIGKTQLGLQYAAAGATQEGRRGVLFDMSSRGDSQNHADYARRLADWSLRPVDAASPPSLATFFAPDYEDGDYLHVFDYRGRQVTRSDTTFEQWQEWQAEIARKLAASIAFLYGNFIRGVRRVVVDGIEPSDRPQDSVQFELFEYVYHQVLRKEPDWVARDLLREHFREHADAVSRALYPREQIGCLLLYTTHEVMLDDLIGRPIQQGDVLSNANTIIYLGKIRDGNRLGRGLLVAKHRGSECVEQIVPYRIETSGIVVD